MTRYTCDQPGPHGPVPCSHCQPVLQSHLQEPRWDRPECCNRCHCGKPSCADPCIESRLQAPTLPVVCSAHDDERDPNCPTCLLIGGVRQAWRNGTATVDIARCREIVGFYDA